MVVGGHKAPQQFFYHCGNNFQRYQKTPQCGLVSFLDERRSAKNNQKWCKCYKKNHKPSHGSRLENIIILIMLKYSKIQLY